MVVIAFFVAIYLKYITCMHHEIIIDLHELTNMHVLMLKYMNVSCSMHGFGTLFMHATN